MSEIKKESDKEEAIIKAILNGDLKKVKEMFSKSVNLEKEYTKKDLLEIGVQFEGDLLRFAALKKEIQIVELLLKIGGGINGITHYFGKNSNLYFGRSEIFLTPLMLACANGEESMVDLLVSKGADINYNHYHLKYESALSLALANGRERVAMNLIKKGARFTSSRHKEYDFHLFLCSCHGGMNSVKIWMREFEDEERKKEIMQPNRKERENMFIRGRLSAVDYAVQGFQLEVLQWLLEMKFDLSFSDSFFDGNVFHYICKSLRRTEEEQIRLLKWLSSKLDKSMINAYDEDDLTPLSLACLKKKSEVGKCLLEIGAKREFEERTVRRLVLLAEERSDSSIATFVAQLGIEFIGIACLPRFFWESLSRRRMEVFVSFVAEGLLHGRMSNVLHWAAFSANPETLERLIEEGANTEERDENGLFPIMCCSSVENLQLLDEKGANYRVVDDEGNTLLHHHAKKKFPRMSTSDRESILDYLIRIELSLDETNKVGKTPKEVTGCRDPYKFTEPECDDSLRDAFFDKEKTKIDQSLDRFSSGYSFREGSAEMRHTTDSAYYTSTSSGFSTDEASDCCGKIHFSRDFLALSGTIFDVPCRRAQADLDRTVEVGLSVTSSEKPERNTTSLSSGKIAELSKSKGCDYSSFEAKTGSSCFKLETSLGHFSQPISQTGIISHPKTDCFAYVPSDAVTAETTASMELSRVKRSDKDGNVEGDIFEAVYLSFSTPLKKPASLFIPHHASLTDAYPSKIYVYHCTSAASKSSWKLIAFLERVAQEEVWQEETKIRLSNEFVIVTTTHFSGFCVNVDGHQQISAQIFLPPPHEFQSDSLDIKVAFSSHCENATARAREELNYVFKHRVNIFLRTGVENNVEVEATPATPSSGWEIKENSTNLVPEVVASLLRDKSSPLIHQFYCKKTDDKACDVRALEVHLRFKSLVHEQSWHIRLGKEITAAALTSTEKPTSLKYTDVALVVAEIGAEKYMELGVRLGFSVRRTKDIVSSCPNAGNLVFFRAVLEAWEDEFKDQATVEHLLNISSNLKIRGAVNEKLRRMRTVAELA